MFMTMKSAKTPRLTGIFASLLASIAVPCQQAAGTSYTLGTPGSWATAANWSPNTGTPGASSGDTANLTNATMVGTITVDNPGPTYGLNKLTLSNLNASLVLDVTNSTLNVTNGLTLYNGSSIQIDNGGILTNSALSIYGSNVVVNLNTNGQWNSGATPSLAASGASLTVAGGGGSWSVAPGTWYIGSGRTNCTLNASGITVTNGASGWIVGGHTLSGVGCLLNISNGCTFNGQGGTIQVGYGSGTPGTACYSNVAWIGGNGSSSTVFLLSIRVGVSAYDWNNTINITNATLNTSSISYLGGGTNSTINIWSGGIWNGGPAQAMTIGYSAGGSNNTFNVYNGGVYNGGGTNAAGSLAAISVGNGAGNAVDGNVLNIFPGGVVSNLYVSMGNTNSASGANYVNVNHGSLLALNSAAVQGIYVGNSASYQSFTASNSILSGGLIVGNVYAASSNMANIVGCTWDMLGGDLYVGYGTSPTGCNYNSANFSASTNKNITAIVVGASTAAGQAQNYYNSAIFSNGCYLQVIGAQISVGNAGTNSGNVLQLGGNGAMSTVSNAGTLFTGGKAGASSNAIVITNCSVFQSGAVTMGSANGTNNTLTIQAGGLLEANSLTANANGNVITNNGGTYQFTTTNLTCAPNGFGNIALNSGTISYRAITNADVFCNQGAKPLNSTGKMLWAGANTFCLNAATNLANQNYTFSTASGTPTNFAGLTLMNGATYQGNVTVGSGGTLNIHGANTITNNLDMSASGSTLALDLAATANSSLNVQGNANFSGAKLQVNLSTAPPMGQVYQIVTATGSITPGPTSVQATLNGKNYNFTIGYSANRVVLYVRGAGTSVFFR